jgi:hypothetical protein
MPPDKNSKVKPDISKFTVAHFCWTHNMEVKRERMEQCVGRPHLIAHTSHAPTIDIYRRPFHGTF